MNNTENIAPVYDLTTPPGCEYAINHVAGRIRTGVGIIDKLRQTLMEAEKELAEAKAYAYINSTGTIPERNAQVVIATAEQSGAVDVAKAALRAAQDHAASLRTDLKAYMSINASVREAYRGSKWGDGA
jgi:hypothetical protein